MILVSGVTHSRTIGIRQNGWGIRKAGKLPLGNASAAIDTSALCVLVSGLHTE